MGRYVDGVMGKWYVRWEAPDAAGKALEARLACTLWYCIVKNMETTSQTL